MEASVATTTSENTGPVGLPRGIGFGILIFIITFGLYGLKDGSAVQVLAADPGEKK